MRNKFDVKIQGQKDLEGIKNEAKNLFFGQFCSQRPFEHLVLDDFLDLKDVEVVNSYLNSGPMPFRVYEKGITGGLHKNEYKPDFNNPSLVNVFIKLSCPAFLSYLEGLTGLDGLVPDPYFDGGGIHETFRSGGLGIHTDFLGHSRLKLKRVLNLIIYITEDWKEEWGGELGLYDDPNSEPLVKVAPLFNRAVVFKTDENSWHGLPRPINPPVGLSRRSIALYYFVNTGGQMSGRSTVYYPSSVGFVDRLRASYTFLKEAVRPWLKK
jgi:hypothetical protein